MSVTKFFLYIVTFFLFLIAPLFLNRVHAQCSGSNSASGYTCRMDSFGDAYCETTSVNLICYDVGGYCAGDQYQASCVAVGGSCSLGGNTQVRCEYDGPPPTRPPPPTEPPPPTRPPPPPPPTTPPDEPTSPPPPTDSPSSCPSPDCETELIGTCADGSPQFRRVCDYGSCGTSEGNSFCGSQSDDEYAPIWIRINSVENGTPVSWKGNQTKDKVTGNTWSVDPLGSDGYFNRFNAYFAGSPKVFDRTRNMVDTSSQMDVWIDSDYGNFEFWSNHFCAQGLAYREGDGRGGSEIIGGNPQQCGPTINYNGAWCKLDPASCAGEWNCVRDFDGCVDAVAGGPIKYTEGARLTGYHEPLHWLMRRLGQRYDDRWSATFWTLESLSGRYSDFAVDIHLKTPVGYRCVSAVGAYAKDEGDTAPGGDFKMESADGTLCKVQMDPRSKGNLVVFTITSDGIPTITPTPTPTQTPLPCPASFSYTCNADGTLATLDWSDVAGAAAYNGRFDASNNWYNSVNGDIVVTDITASTYTLPVVPNRSYIWSIETKRALTDSNIYDNRCIAGNLTCVPQLTNVSLQLRGVSANVNTSIKGSGLRSSNATPPEVGTDLNNEVRATITTNGTNGSTGVLGVAFTPSSNNCSELENPATGVTPRPTGVIHRILATDANSDFINKGIFIAYAQNNIANFYGKAMTQGRFYVHYNDAWVASYGTAVNQLNVPSNVNPAFTVKLNRATFTAASGNVQFDISFNKALGSQLWYSRAYGANSTLSSESTTQCITPGDPNEGNSY